MACCAFALFILGQLAAGFVAMRRAVPFGLLGRPSLEPISNPATAWQLSAAPLAAAALPAPTHSGWRTAGRALAIAALFELALVGAAAAWGLHDSHVATSENPDTIWCGRMIP